MMVSGYTSTPGAISLQTPGVFGPTALAIPLAGATLPAEAEACSPGPQNGACFYYDQWAALAPVNAAAIPIDGVLVLQGAQTGNSPDADWLAAIELTVTRDGQPIAGAVETTDVNDVLVWRPAAPLVPGATYEVVGSLDNPDEDPEGEECGPDLLPLAFTFKADAGPAASLAGVATIAEEVLTQTPAFLLESLICCDGAMPFMEQDENCAYEVDWNEGECATQVAWGRLKVGLTVEGAPPSTLAMTSRELVFDGVPGGVRRVGGELVAHATKPICTQVIVRNLATGETAMSEKTCHGQAVADQLGPQPIDPAPALADLCAGPAYVCEVVGLTAWDPDACSAWPEEAETGGDSTGEPGTGGDSTGEPGTGGDSTTGEPGTGGDASTGEPGTGEPGTGGPTTGEPGTGGEDTGAPTSGDTGTQGTSTGAPGTGGDTTGGAETAGDSGSADSGAQDGLVDHGCACDSGGSSPALVGLGLVALSRRRRRR